jgi:predicted transcriptional regulator
MKKLITNVFFRKAPLEILKNMQKSTYCSEIARKSDITHSHIKDILNILESERFIIKEKIGRIVEIRLTEKGKKLSEYIFEMLEDLENGPR